MDELPMMIRGTLDTELVAGGSAVMRIANSEQTIPVYDWLLSPGQSIAAGTKVVATLDVLSRRYYAGNSLSA